jgi:hypothetical protein
MIVRYMGGIANGNQQEGVKKRRVEKLQLTLVMWFNFKIHASKTTCLL